MSTFESLVEVEKPSTVATEIYLGGVVLSINSNSSIPSSAVDIVPSIGGYTQLELLLEYLYDQTVIRKTAAVTIGGHRVVRVASDGVRLVSSEELLHAGAAVGITTGAALAGDLATVKFSGEISEPSWNWTPTFPVFIGNEGQLKQSPPSFPDAFSQVVGIATSATSIAINIQSPIILI